MQLTQGQHGLAIALCIERDGDAKASGIIVDVRPMLDLKQPRCLDAQEPHAVLIARAVRADVDEAPATTGGISISRVSLLKPSGENHCEICVGSFHAWNTRSCGASITRVITISRSSDHVAR